MFRSTVRIVFGMALATWLTHVVITDPAQAQPRAVIELFTSQGCSSCPPADRLLAELARDPSLVALSWHIDYWDYLGWKDTFSQPAFTARQKAYASVKGSEEVYTPQVVVNGGPQMVGSDRSEIDAALSIQRGSELTVPITLDGKGSSVRVSIGSAPAGPQTGTLYLLPVLRSRDVAIGRGENAHHAVTYANVVRAIRPLTTWTGEAKSLDVPLDKMGDSDGYFVLLQSGSPKSPGVVLGAAKGP
ncbi:MAG: DUF1223 domain-containing protein [Methyloceanibacter sp.]